MDAAATALHTNACPPHCCCCRAPVVQAVQTSPHSGSVDITEPTLGSPWAKYELEICPTAGLTSDCIGQDCSPVVAAPGKTTCAIGDPTLELLKEQTGYTVTVVAVKADGTTKSLPGSDTFTTPSHT